MEDWIGKIVSKWHPTLLPAHTAYQPKSSQRYLTQFYYSNSDTNTWEAYFIITWKLDILLSVSIQTNTVRVLPTLIAMSVLYLVLLARIVPLRGQFGITQTPCNVPLPGNGLDCFWHLLAPHSYSSLCNPSLVHTDDDPQNK